MAVANQTQQLRISTNCEASQSAEIQSTPRTSREAAEWQMVEDEAKKTPKQRQEDLNDWYYYFFVHPIYLIPESPPNDHSVIRMI